MNYASRPAQHPLEVTHAGHAPPKFRFPTTTASSPSINTLPPIRRSFPPAPCNKASSSGLSSSQENDITAKLHSFEHHIPLKHDVKYIYAVNPTAPNTVYFFEYRGHSTPLPGIGTLGDVYVDITQDSYALFAKSIAGWVQWTAPAGLQHPFLTDTILWVSLDNVEWVHPTEIDKHSHAADIHSAIHDLLVHERESPQTTQVTRTQMQPEANDRDESDSTAAGNGSRKRPRVEEESPVRMVCHVLLKAESLFRSSPCLITNAPLPPIVCLFYKEVGVHLTEVPLSEITSTPAPRENGLAAYSLRKRNMDSRISGLQEEMAKLQKNLSELQLENARVIARNEHLEREVHMMRSTNEKLEAEANERTMTNGTHPTVALSVGGVRGQPASDRANSTCAESVDSSILRSVARLLSCRTDTGSSQFETLPVDIQSTLEGHATHRKFNLQKDRREEPNTDIFMFVLSSSFSHFYYERHTRCTYSHTTGCDGYH